MKKIKEKKLRLTLIILLIIILLILQIQIVLSLDDSVGIIGVDPEVWDLGYTGSGVDICIIDSGVNASHLDLSGKIADEYCFCRASDPILGSNCCPNGSETDTNAEDYQGHGTHIAGIIASQDGTYKGVAYDSTLYVVKVLNSEGEGDIDDMGLAIDWCVNQGVDIISISSGDEQRHGLFCPNDIDTNIDNAYDAGIPIIAASGNEGYTDGIIYPACNSKVISVGSTTKSNQIDEGDYYVDGKGSNTYKTLDLLAPGVYIKSLIWSPNEKHPECIAESEEFMVCGGTSMATPHVSGLVALLQDMYGGTLNPDDIEEILEETGEPITDPRTGDEFPRIDGYAAIKYAPFADVLHEDWPFYLHDLRRTGFTSIQGDFNQYHMLETTWDFDKNLDAAYFDYPSIADVDRGDEMEIITASSRWGAAGDFDGKLYAISYNMDQYNIKGDHPVRRDKEWVGDSWQVIDHFNTVWEFEDLPDSYIIPRAPSISNLKGGSTKYVVFIAQPNNTEDNSYVYSVNGKTGKEKNRYTIPKDPLQNWTDVPQYGQTAIVDIDLSGKEDVLFADYAGSQKSQSFLYWLDHNLNSKGKYAIGNYTFSGGAIGAVAIANINKSDAYPEIVVPSAYGIYVYRYDANTDSLVKMWNNSDDFIDYTAVIADVDINNDFEIIYTTTNHHSVCGQVSCTKELHVVDALTGNNQIYDTLTEYGKYAPVVANLDNDKYLEIVLMTRDEFTIFNNPSYGRVRVFDGVTLNEQWQYPTDSSKDITYAAPSIADIDNDDDFDIVASFEDGELAIIDNDGTYKFSYNLGGDIASAPAIADLDNDGKVEIAAKHISTIAGARVFNYETYLDYTPGQFAAMDEELIDSTLSFVGNENDMPYLNIVKDIYVKEGDLISIIAEAIDTNNDTIIYNYTYPFNSSGQWQTNVNSSGYYVITAEASDGNLTEEQDLLVRVFDSNTTHQDQFSDSTTEKNLTYTEAGNKTVYVNVSKLQTMLRAALEIFGNPLNKTQGSYQSPSATIIEYNDLDSTESNAIDGNWYTYYTAGALTGIITQWEGLTVPANPSHLVLHTKLRVYRGGYGNIGLYNYDTDTYEITNSIPSFTNASDDFYIDFYENSPLWTNNNTHFSAQVDNISNYINSTDVRWYYRYVGDWASQMVYESEVKFVDDGQYPEDVFVDVGNDGSKDFVAWGELHDDRAIQKRMNNSNYEETLQLLANTAVTRYITLPKNITLFDAEIFIGETEVSGLAITENTESTAQVVNPNYQEKTLRIRDLYTFNTIIQTNNNQTLLSIELTEKNRDKPIVIRDVFVKSNDILGRIDTKLMGHTPLYYEFSEVGDKADLQINLKRKIDNIQYNTTDYLMYNYYYIKDDETTENGEYTQYIGAELT